MKKICHCCGYLLPETPEEKVAASVKAAIVLQQKQVAQNAWDNFYQAKPPHGQITLAVIIGVILATIFAITIIKMHGIPNDMDFLGASISYFLVAFSVKYFFVWKPQSEENRRRVEARKLFAEQFPEHAEQLGFKTTS